MAERTVHAHEVSEDRRVAIVVQGEIDLDMLESIESFCHRQRFRIVQRMDAQLREAAALRHAVQVSEEEQRG